MKVINIYLVLTYLSYIGHPLGEVHKYLRKRSQKYINSEDVTRRLDELKKDAAECLHTLFVIVFDEAHHGATSFTSDLNNSGDQARPSPYNKLAGSWNSEDFPNVVVLLVSATAWNLQG